MKYMLMMAGTKKGWDTLGAWPKQDLKAHIGFMLSQQVALRIGRVRGR